MATETITIPPSETVTLSDSRVEAFEIPGTHLVHGNTFPLGVRVKNGRSFDTIEESAKHLQKLSDAGTLKSLLRQRE